MALRSCPSFWAPAARGDLHPLRLECSGRKGRVVTVQMADRKEKISRLSWYARKTAVFERKQRFFVTFLFIFFLTLFCQIVFDHITATDRKNRRPPELLFRRAVFCSQQAFSLARRGSSSFFISLISSASFCSHSSSVGA